MNTNLIELKRSLTTQELEILRTELERKKKSIGIAYMPWFFLSVFGLHKFYLGKVRQGDKMEKVEISEEQRFCYRENEKGIKQYDHGARGGSHFPQLLEFVTTLGIGALGILAFKAAAKQLPFFPETEH